MVMYGFNIKVEIIPKVDTEKTNDINALNGVILNISMISKNEDKLFINTLKGLGMNRSIIIVKEKRLTYKILLFLLADIFNKFKNKVIVICASIKVSGNAISSVFNILGVVNTIQMLFKISIIFKNLHKLFFVFWTYITRITIIKSDGTRNRFNIFYLIQISNIRFMTSYIGTR